MGNEHRIENLRSVIMDQLTTKDIAIILRPCASLNTYIDFGDGFMVHFSITTDMEDDGIPLRCTIYTMNYTGEISYTDTGVNMHNFKCTGHWSVNSYTLAEDLNEFLQERNLYDNSNWPSSQWQNASTALSYYLTKSICLSVLLEYDTDFEDADEYQYNEILYGEYEENESRLDDMVIDLLKKFNIDQFVIYDDYRKKPTSVYTPDIELSSPFNNRLYKFDVKDTKNPDTVNIILQFINNAVDSIDRTYAPNTIFPVLYADFAFVFVDNNDTTTDSILLCVQNIKNDLSYNKVGYYQLSCHNRIDGGSDDVPKIFKTKEKLIDEMITVVCQYFEKHKNERCGISYSRDTRLHLIR